MAGAVLIGADLAAGFWAVSSSSELESSSEESSPAAVALVTTAFTGAALAAGFLVSSSSELDSGWRFHKKKTSHATRSPRLEHDSRVLTLT